MARAFCFGDNVDTDQIIPGNAATSTDPAELAKHCLEGADPTFADRVQPGDVIVAGENFGSGSSREHAALAIVGTGVDAVVAESFARIFFRNGINVGLPLLTIDGVTDEIEDGDTVTVSPSDGFIENETRGVRLSSVSYPDFITELIDAGGLIPYGRQLDEPGEPPE